MIFTVDTGLKSSIESRFRHQLPDNGQIPIKCKSKLVWADEALGFSQVFRTLAAQQSVASSSV